MQIQRNNQQNNIYFKAGKTKLYTDFDGTFLPFSHNDVCSNGEMTKNSLKISQFNKMYTKFSNFCKKAQDKFAFIITTGRTKGEFDFVTKQIKQQNLKFVLPEKLIVSDGSDCFEFVSDTKEHLSKEKIEKIKSISPSWDRNKIVNNLKRIINNQNPNIIILDTPVNKHEYDYGDLSLEHALKFKKDKDKSKYASFVNDAELSIDIAFPHNMDISKIEESFQEYIENSDLKVKISKCAFDAMTYIPSYKANNDYSLEPGKTISIKPFIYPGHTLSKLYDTKQKVQENIHGKTDDLVVVAGDGSNDESMLNPLNYMDLYGIKIHETNNLDKLLENEEILSNLKDLPLVSIIVGNDPKLEHLRQLGKKLDKKGILKIISIQDSKKDFVNSIKQGMLDYSTQNDKYRRALGQDLFCELLEQNKE